MVAKYGYVIERRKEVFVFFPEVWWTVRDDFGVVAKGNTLTYWGARRQMKRAIKRYERTGDERIISRDEGEL